MSSHGVQAIRQSRAAVFTPDLPCAAHARSNDDPRAVYRYRFCPSPTRRILAIGALRRDLSPAAFTRQSEARNPVNECNAGASAMFFRTASTVRSNSTSLITRSKAGPTFCRLVGKRARARHRSSREFVVRRLCHGRFGGKIGPKSGRSSPHDSRNRRFHRRMVATPWPYLPDAC
jgi:hypothetical protein